MLEYVHIIDTRLFCHKIYHDNIMYGVKSTQCPESTKECLPKKSSA